MDAIIGFITRAVVTVLAASLVPMLAAGPASAEPPTNDAFASAAAINGSLPVSVSGTNVEATKQPGEPAHAGNAGGRSIWYSWTADLDGLVVLDTCASTFDTLLAVYTGGTLAELVPVVSDDDTCSTRSSVRFIATSGQTYRIAVDGYGGSSGSITLALRAGVAPANDDLADALTLAGPLPISSAASNVDATKEVGEPDHAGSVGGASVWFSWTPDASRSIVVEACMTSFPTMIAVYTGETMAALNPVASSRGGCLGARVSFAAAAGETYRIVVDGSQGATGTIPLMVRAATGPANDAFADAEALPATSAFAVDGTTNDATTEPGEPDHAGVVTGASVWYRWTPDASEPVVIGTCGSENSWNSVLGVYTGSTLDGLTPVAGNDDTRGCGLYWSHSRVVFEAEAGETYWIAVGGRHGTSGNLELEILPADPPTNDAFAAADVINGTLPVEATGSNDDANKEPGEPAHAGNPGGASVWYRWTPQDDGTVVIDTCGSDFDTLLGVYTGTTVDGLVAVASNDNTANCGFFGSRVRLAVTGGTEYRIAVDGPKAATGSIELSIRAAGASGNDAFADAQVLDGALPISVTGTNLDATKEAGEPAHAGNAGGASLWYAWTAETSGEIVVDTCASAIDTLLGLYTGDDVSGLTEVTSNDNTSGCGASPASGRGSRLRFTADAGETYWIAVDGFNGVEGAVALSVRAASRPTNDDFEDAAELAPGLPLEVTGSNVDATQEPGEPAHAGSVGGASVWYRWTPDRTGQVLVESCAVSSARIAVYTGAALDALNRVASNDNTGTCSSSARFTATAGTTYRIAFDRPGGATGPFVLAIRPAPANDHFADAEELRGTLPIEASGSSRDASREQGEPLHAGVVGRRSIWYQWTADSAEPILVDLCGSSIDTALGVYTGTAVQTLTAVASNDDACGRASSVAFRPTPGTTYRIGVDSRDVGGPFELTIRRPNLPPNDAFAAAQPLSGVLPLTAHGTNVDATNEAGEPGHAGFPASGSVWYRWSAGVSGPVVVDLCESTFDTVVGVYTGDSAADLTSVAADDDGCGPGAGSLLRFDATAGQTYSIAVDGWQFESGTFTLALRMPPRNDDFADAEMLDGPLPIDAAGTTVDASAEPAEGDHAGFNAHASIWYSWTAATDGLVVLDTCGSHQATALALYAGSALDALTEIGADAYGAECGIEDGAWLRRSVQAGVTYRIAVETGIDRGPFALHITAAGTAPTNDNFDNATTVSGALPVEIKGTTQDASNEPGEPDHADVPARAGSVWYRWTAGVAGPVEVGTCESAGDTLLGVYTGDAVDDLVEVAADDDGCGPQSRVTFSAVIGETYHIAVDSPAGESGPVTVRLRRVVAPSNDNFADAERLSPRLPARVSGRNVNASRETDEAADATRSVWYRWTPAVTADVVVETCGSDFDTVLGVNTGTALSTLTEVARNDDHCGLQSRVMLAALAGETYRIAVDGFGGETGSIRLRIRPVDPPANDDFAAAHELNGHLPIATSGSNVDATTEPGEPAHSPFAEASVWYRWTATSTGPVVAETCGSESDTVLAVYTGTALDELAGIAGDHDGCGLNSRVPFAAEAGQTYRIAVAGAGVGTGEFDVRLRELDRPSNDPFADAQVLTPRLPIAVEGTNIDASSEPFEPRPFGPEAVSVWYRWTPEMSREVVIDTCASDFPTTLALYAGDSLARLEEVARDVYGCATGPRASIRFFARAGTTYSLAIAGDRGEMGSIALEIRPVPANDDIDAAQEMTNTHPSQLQPITARGSTVDATSQAGEPAHAHRTGGASVWYRWTAPASVPVRIDTCGSDVDTILGVYTGTAVNRLTEAASNDDACGAASRVRFQATAGETYLIAVDGVDGGTGPIRLSIRAEREHHR